MKVNLRGSTISRRRRGRNWHFTAAFGVRRRMPKRVPRTKSNAVVGDSGERNWLDLPREVVLTIFRKLSLDEVLTRVQGVCSLWRSISMDPFLWRTINMHNPVDLGYDHHYEILCRRAVDYSCGQLVDISVNYFPTDDLLLHIADSARHLRHLRLVGCYRLSNAGLCEVVEKLSQLEEVDISICSLSENCIEAIGRNCPQLKSFKFNMKGFTHPHIEFDDGVFAIAKTMPKLRQLQLFGNKLTNGGLLAILDGCPHLESLDLRQCYNLNLGESLGKRCAEQIKDLRLPHDSIYDHPSKGEIDYGSLGVDFAYLMDPLSDDDYLSDYHDDYDFSGSENDYVNYIDYYTL